MQFVGAGLGVRWLPLQDLGETVVVAVWNTGVRLSMKEVDLNQGALNVV